MAVSPAKENILKKIRAALSHPTPLPFPQSEGTHSVFEPPADDLEVLFAEEFSRLQGKFAYCADRNDLVKQIQQLVAEKKWTRIYGNEAPWDALFTNSTDLAACDAAITGCEFLVARTGTIVLSAAQAGGRTASVYAPVHICIAYTNQLVYDIRDALAGIRERYAGKMPSLVSFATGPSRTADIEKTLVTGVHGPKEVYCFLIES